MWGTLALDYQYYMDDDEKPTSAEFFDAMARENALKMEDLRERVRVTVSAYRIYDGEKTTVFASFLAMCEYINVNKYDYIFVYDSVRAFSTFDYSIQTDKTRPWERDKKDERVNHEQHTYRKVTGWKYAELSGEAGQRYKFSIWTPARQKNRHVTTHGTDFYGFKNIMTRRFEDTRAAFKIPAEMPEEISLYNIIEQFNAVCADGVKTPFLGAKKPLSFTCGGLAKFGLLKTLYPEYDDVKIMTKKFKYDHVVTPAQYSHLIQRKLLRGGAVYIDERVENKELNETIYKYDENSHYAAIAAKMPDFKSVHACKDIAEFLPQNRKKERTYIVILSHFGIKAKKGFPAVFQNPFTLTQRRREVIDVEFAIFADELDALALFYDFEILEVKQTLYCMHGARKIFEPYAREWFSRKDAAKNATPRNYAMYEFSKLMLNSAWGKLAQRGDFPEFRHELNEVSGIVELRKYNKEDAGASSSLGLIHGAYITSAARCKLWRRILDICGTERPRDYLIYTDTDSIHTRVQARDDIIDARKMGFLKLECVATYSCYVAKKVYYNISRENPLEIDAHVRGMFVKEVFRELSEAYGEELENIPPSGIYTAFTCGKMYATPILANVNGGRALMYVRKKVNASASYTSQGKLLFSIDRSNGEIVEL